MNLMKNAFLFCLILASSKTAFATKLPEAKLFVEADSLQSRVEQPIHLKWYLIVKHSLKTFDVISPADIEGAKMKSDQSVKSFEFKPFAYGGQVYQRTLIDSKIIVPEKSGRIVVSPLEIGVVTLQRKNKSNEDSFQGKSHHLNLKSEPIEILVQ